MSPDPIGYGDGLNLYAYVGNDPANFTDPSGECPSCIGAATSVVFGVMIRGVTGGDILDMGALMADAALGAVGAGIANKATQLVRLQGTGLSARKQLAATSNLKRAPSQGVYFLRSKGRSYVGQSGDLAKRSGQSAVKHELTAAPGVRIGVGGGKTSREVAEHNVLKKLGGPGGPSPAGVQNTRYPIGKARSDLLHNPKFGKVGSVYAQGVGKPGSFGAGIAAGALK